MIVALAELTLVLVLACTLDRLTTTRVRPQVRHALWMLVAIRLLLPTGLPGLSPATVALDAGSVAHVTGVLESHASSWILGGWGCGAAFFLVRACWQAGAAGRRMQVFDPAPDSEARGLVDDLRTTADRIGVRHLPAICVDPGAPFPSVTGLWTPRLVLPGNWRAWPAVTLEHALAHELTHIARRDLQAEAVWILISCVYWFHPLAHAARRRAHEAREMCCDADARARLGPGYRFTLLRVLAAAAGETDYPHRAPGAHAWHPVIARLHALDRWPRPPGRRHRLALAALVPAAAVVILPAHLTLAPRPAPIAVEKLLDAAARQELGLGSLHLRYALRAAEAARTDREERGTK